MMLDIYRSGSINLSIHIDDKTVFSQKLMGECMIDCTYESASVIDVKIGDYIVFKGENYYINRDPSVKKYGSNRFSYGIKFESNQYELRKVDYSTVSSVGYIDGLSEFYLFGKAQMFLNLIVANMNRDRSGWTVGTVVDTKEKNLYFNNENCLSVLNRLCQEFELEFEIVGKQVSLKNKVGTTTAYNLKYGKHNGLYSISKEPAGSDDVVTRLKAFGSDKNLLYSYRNHSERLKFVVGGKSYVENNTALYGVIESSVTWDDIFPHRTGTLSALGSDIYKFSDSGMDFDVNNYLLPGVSPKVHFQTGDCAGYEFEINSYNNSTKEFTIIKVTDSQGFEMPNATLKPKVGDTYVLVDIQMPQTYIDAAETELYNRAVSYLNNFLSVPRVNYSLVIDRLYSITLGIGDELTVSDTDLGINKVVRVIGIRYPLIDQQNIKIDLSNKSEKELGIKMVFALEDQKRTASIIRNEDIPKAVRESALYAQSIYDTRYLIKYSQASPGPSAQHVYSDVYIHGNIFSQGDIIAYSETMPPDVSWWAAMPQASGTILGGIKLGTGLTYNAVTGKVDASGGSGVSSWNSLNDRPAWLIYGTLAEFQSGHSHNWTQINGRPTLATVATSGSYNDLGNKPDLSVYQPVSTAINSGNIASQSVNYSNTAGNANNFGGQAPAYYQAASSAWNTSNLNPVTYKSTSDFNNLHTGSFDAQFVRGTMQAANNPNDGANYYNVIQSTFHDTNYSSQIAVSLNSSTIFSRTYFAGSWGGWNKYYHSGNLNRTDTDFTARQVYATNVYTDTIEAGGTDTLELNYYTGGDVIIGQLLGNGGSKNLKVNRIYTNSDIYATGELYSNGNSAAIYFQNRTGTNKYAWYAESDIVRLYNQNVGDILTIANNGVLTTNDIGSNGWIRSNYGSIYSRDNGNGSIELATYQGSLPGYSSNYYPTLKGSGIIYIAASGSYVGAITSGGIHLEASKQFRSWGDGFKSYNYHGMVGDYDQNSTASKIIWTIGDSWNSIASHYGLGYEYFSGNYGHSYVIRENGGVNIILSGSTGSIWGAGSLTMAGDITAFSDRILKTDLRPLSNVLDKIQFITGYSFLRVDSNDGKRHIGLIAQEVQSQFPELVNKNSDGILSLNYQNYVAVLNEAIKEQQAKIEKLEKKVYFLERRGV